MIKVTSEQYNETTEKFEMVTKEYQNPLPAILAAYLGEEIQVTIGDHTDHMAGHLTPEQLQWIGFKGHIYRILCERADCTYAIYINTDRELSPAEMKYEPEQLKETARYIGSFYVCGPDDSCLGLLPENDIWIERSVLEYLDELYYRDRNKVISILDGNITNWTDAITT